MAVELINITDVQADETNVNWYANGERANEIVLNRPIKNVAAIVNTLITDYNTFTENVTGEAGDISFIPTESITATNVQDAIEQLSSFGGGGGTASMTKTTFTATEGQTTFEVDYVPGLVDVFIEGIRLVEGVTFTATDGNNVVLTTGATAGDTIVVVAFAYFSVADTSMLKETFIGTEGQTTFAVDYVPGLVDVYVEGIRLVDGVDFTATDGSNIILTSGVLEGDTVEVIAFQAFGVADAYTKAEVDAALLGKADDTHTHAISDVTDLQTSLDEKANADNPVLSGSITEQVYNLIGTALEPDNGTIQSKTITANTTFTDGFSDGQSITLRISGGDTYPITWPTMTWITSAGNVAPTLNGTNDAFVLWKEGTTLFGAVVGHGGV